MSKNFEIKDANHLKIKWIESYLEINFGLFILKKNIIQNEKNIGLVDINRINKNLIEIIIKWIYVYYLMFISATTIILVFSIINQF